MSIKYRRIVIKVGTSTLTGPSGEIDLDYMEDLAGQVSSLLSQGVEILLVTSGAIRAGLDAIGLSKRPATIPEKQAAAAVGQGRLMQMYLQAFMKHGVTVAQMLLTRADFGDRRRYLNARNTTLELFRHGIVPVVNENDTVSVDEIRVGDNDTLAALVAANLEADLLILLSDVDGLYDGNPSVSPDAALIPVVEKIDSRIRNMAGGAGSDSGTGGMRTKINAASIATKCGVTMVIANGRRKDVILDTAAGAQTGTRFLPLPECLCGRKRWIAFGATPRGSVTVNQGAEEALRDLGRSLLAAGITGVSGKFARGDLVRVIAAGGTQVARGFVNYSASEIEKIMGSQSGRIEALLGHKDFDEVIHRDNMVLAG